MKEFKTIEVDPVPIPTHRLIGKNRLFKRWKTAQRRTPGQVNADQNFMVELHYHKILVKVKNLFATSPFLSSQLVFEKDYKEDNTENSFTMHSFISSSFFWYLECDFAYCYMVEYDFHNCPFEQEIRELIESSFWGSTRVNQKPQKPNCEEFYKRVLKVQDKEYFNLL